MDNQSNQNQSSQDLLTPEQKARAFLKSNNKPKLAPYLIHLSIVALTFSAILGFFLYSRPKKIQEAGIKDENALKLVEEKQIKIQENGSSDFTENKEISAVGIVSRLEGDMLFLATENGILELQLTGKTEYLKIDPNNKCSDPEKNSIALVETNKEDIKERSTLSLKYYKDGDNRSVLRVSIVGE